MNELGDIKMLHCRIKQAVVHKRYVMEASLALEAEHGTEYPMTREYHGGVVREVVYMGGATPRRKKIKNWHVRNCILCRDAVHSAG